MIEAVGTTWLKYTGTPPNSQKIKLIGDQGSTIVRIPYPNSGSYNLILNDAIVDFNDWDSDINNYAAIKGNKGCGENRFVGVENIFDFYLEAGCEI